MSQSEPFFLPLFFALCIHMLLFVLLSYWGEWELPTQNTLGPSISVALRTLPPAPPKPVPKPAAARPDPPEVKEKEAEVKEKIPVETDKKELDELIKNLRETESKEEEPAPRQEKQELLIEEQAASNEEEDSPQRQEMRNEALAYYQRNKELVERNFNPGTTAQRKQFQDLVTRIKIFLDERGRLVDVEIVATSGNRLFDIEAERAVRRVDSFIIPSNKRLQENYFREIIMEFSLSSDR